jgi:hypothetical protein
MEERHIERDPTELKVEADHQRKCARERGKTDREDKGEHEQDENYQEFNREAEQPDQETTKHLMTSRVGGGTDKDG